MNIIYAFFHILALIGMSTDTIIRHADPNSTAFI